MSTRLGLTLASGLCVASLVLSIAPIAARSRRSASPLPTRRRVSAAGRRLLGDVRAAAPRLVEAASRRDLARTIAAAGLAGRVSRREVGALRVLCAASMLLAVPRLCAPFPARMWPVVAALAFAAASEAPLFWLRARARRRLAAMHEALPDALDLLRACLAAGLPLRRALRLVGDHGADPVAGEFAAVAAATALGVPQAQALARLAEHNPSPELRAFVNAVGQAERHGSPLAPVIAAQAADARLALNRAVVERGARAGPKIQLIVSTTIVPGALLGIAATVIAAIARGDLRLI